MSWSARDVFGSIVGIIVDNYNATLSRSELAIAWYRYAQKNLI